MQNRTTMRLLYSPCNQQFAGFKSDSLPASVAQLDAPSDWRPGGRGFNPRRGRQHSFVEIDHEIFSTVILSLPLIQEGQLSVSGERMCTILVNRLEDQACPVNVWLGELTALDMTPLGWLGRKTSTQRNKSDSNSFLAVQTLQIKPTNRWLTLKLSKVINIHSPKWILYNRELVSYDTPVYNCAYGNHLRWSLYRAGILPPHGLYECYTGNLCT